MRWILRWSLLSILALLTGCVAGQSIRMDYAPQAVAAEKLGVSVEVSCADQRAFVVDGSKLPNYIGHYRAGFGNTWAVTTSNKQPLAANLEQDVASDLTALGFDVVGQGAARELRIVIEDWNFDTYINGKMWYRVQVSVESGGAVLASSLLEDSTEIKGSVWVGAKYAFEKEVPKIYRKVVGDVARNNPQVLAALKSK